MTPGLDITVNVGGSEPSAGSEPQASAVPSTLLERAVLHVLRAEGVEDAEISLTLLTDDEIRALNRRYLSKDRTTDVIAFSLGDEAHVLGDVYVGVEEAKRQADGLGVPLDEELARLAIHGTLHVLGHDHPEGEDRDDSPMYTIQERLLREVLKEV